MSFRTVVVSTMSKCTYRDDYLVVRQMDRSVKIHLSEIDVVIFESASVLISSYLLAELAKAKKLVIFCDQKHLPISMMLPYYGACNMRSRCEEQMGWSKPSQKKLWKRVVQHKIQRQSEVLSTRNLSEAENLGTWSKEVASGDTTNREGCSAALYFPALFGEGFTRSEDSTTNAALNFGYQVLLGYVSREIASRGYLTQLGIHHCSQYNHFNLASDLMEPFRPLIDDYVEAYPPEVLDLDYKVKLLQIFNQKVHYLDGNYKVSSVIDMYVEDCFRVLNKKMSVEELVCYEINHE